VPGAAFGRRVRVAQEDRAIGEGNRPCSPPLAAASQGRANRCEAGRPLVTFFAGTLALPPDAVRVWFNGSKGIHIVVRAPSR
jgi:hypothetical protein